MAFAKLVKRWGADEVVRRVDYAFDHPADWRNGQPVTWSWFVKNFDLWAGPTPAPRSTSNPDRRRRDTDDGNRPASPEELMQLAAAIRARGGQR